MSRELLDRTETYLELFSDKIEIDKNLPKWKKVEQCTKNLEAKKIIASDLNEIVDYEVPSEFKMKKG